eukprot:jgi/Tetstr1/434240/TSEL_023350.t1
MRTTRAALLAALAALLLSAAFLAAPVRAQDEDVSDEDDYEDEERAFLLVKKSVVEDAVVQGRNFTVRLELFNVGATCAPANTPAPLLTPHAPPTLGPGGRQV